MTTSISSLATEAIESHRTVQYLTKEEHFCEEFNRQMKAPHKKTLLCSLLQAIIFAFNISFIYFNFASSYRYGLWLISNGNSTPYIVFQVIESLNLASFGLLQLGVYVTEYIKGRVSLDMIFDLLEKQPKIDISSEGGKRTDIKGNLRVDKLYFAYPSNKENIVLKGIPADFIKGKTVALVGASGCGKSTMVQLIQRLYDPIDGRIVSDGHDIREVNLHHLRSHMGVVSQEPSLFNYTIRENITYGLVGLKQAQIEQAARVANAHQFIIDLPEGYNTIVGEKGSLLSIGQKQRVAIARAIIRNPEILLLDEATSALDSQNEKEVQEALDRAREGRTCIVIAHRLSSIQNSDLILVLKDGQIVEEGSHQQLLSKNGLYAKLIEKQNLE